MSTKRKATFNKDLEQEYPFIKKTKSESDVKCIKCTSSFSIANGGKYDIERHLKTDRHKRADASASSSKPMTSFLQKERFGEKEKNLAAAEGTWAYHSVQHNLSFRSMDCTSKLIKKCFESTFACARTKTEAILNNVFLPDALEHLKTDLSHANCVTLYCDCSNHGNIKLCPLLVRYFLPCHGVKVKVLEVKNLGGETSEIISDYITETLSSNKLSSKVLALCADNTNCNFGGSGRGGKNNVFYRMQQVLGRKLIGVNCAAHILNNCMKAATDCLPIDVEVITVKIFSFFYIYTVRVEQLKEICENVDVHYQNLLGYTKTRWLALRPAMERILKLFKPLKTYFLSQDKCPTLLKQFFDDPFAEVWLYFVHSQSAVFHDYTLKIESQKASMMEVNCILKDLKMKMSERKREVFIPITITKMLRDLEGRGNNIENFKSAIKSFYGTSVEYLDQWTRPFDEVKNFDWVLLQSNSICWSQVQEAVNFIQEIRPDLEIDDNELFDEVTCIKSFLTDEKMQQWKVSDLEVARKWVDIFCHFDKNSIRFRNISKLIEFCLCLPGSNAPTERVFSLMNNFWTSEKSQLQVSTLKSALIVKCNFDLSCSDFKEYLATHPSLLKMIRSGQKYTNE